MYNIVLCISGNRCKYYYYFLQKKYKIKHQFLRANMRHKKLDRLLCTMSNWLMSNYCYIALIYILNIAYTDGGESFQIVFMQK